MTPPDLVVSYADFPAFHFGRIAGALAGSGDFPVFDDGVAVQEVLEAARAARKRLEELTKHEHLPRDTVAYLRAAIGLRTRLDLDDIDHARGHDGQTTEDVVRRIEQEMRDAARQAVVRLRDRNVIGQEALRRVQNDLDLDEIRSADDPLTGVGRPP